MRTRWRVSFRGFQPGVRLDSCFCTNAICAPSRATILTGLYSHMNGVLTLDQDLDNNLSNFAKLLKADGYQTAIVGKWHLGHDTAHQPRDFDFWRILPGQGAYHAPEFIDSDGRQQHDGYVTDLITDFSLDWLDNRPISRSACWCITKPRTATGSQTTNTPPCTPTSTSRSRPHSTTITATAR